MDVERLLGHVAERGLMSLPAERTDRQIRVDALDCAGSRACRRARRRRDRTRPPWWSSGCSTACPSALRALARGLRLGVQLGAHLARQAGDRTEAEDVRGIALIRAAGALAVAAQKRVLRLRARAVGSALRVTAEAPEGVGPAGRALVDATQLRRVVDRLAVRAAAAPAVLGTERGIRTARRRR